jgi:hypothetical protein
MSQDQELEMMVQEAPEGGSSQTKEFDIKESKYKPRRLLPRIWDFLKQTWKDKWVDNAASNFKQETYKNESQRKLEQDLQRASEYWKGVTVQREDGKIVQAGRLDEGFARYVDQRFRGIAKKYAEATGVDWIGNPENPYFSRTDRFKGSNIVAQLIIDGILKEFGFRIADSDDIEALRKRTREYRDPSNEEHKTYNEGKESSSFYRAPIGIVVERGLERASADKVTYDAAEDLLRQLDEGEYSVVEDPRDEGQEAGSKAVLIKNSDLKLGVLDSGQYKLGFLLKPGAKVVSADYLSETNPGNHYGIGVKGGRIKSREVGGGRSYNLETPGIGSGFNSSVLGNVTSNGGDRAGEILIARDVE